MRYTSCLIFTEIFIMIIQACAVIRSYKSIKFNGGGIYFWWQAGAAKFLQERTDAVDNLSVVGSSAGALTATLFKSGADFDFAAEYAIYQCKRDKLFESPLGLAGVWGPIVREWLDRCIPSEIDAKSLTNLYIAATPLNLLKPPVLLQEFDSKHDVINACMSSVHIPFFMNKQPFSQYKGRKYIDGSFWPFIASNVHQYPEPFESYPHEVLVVDWQRDEQLRNEFSRTQFLDLITPEGLNVLMNYGYNYMQKQLELGIIPETFSKHDCCY